MNAGAYFVTVGLVSTGEPSSKVMVESLGFGFLLLGDSFSLQALNSIKKIQAMANWMADFCIWQL
jgi:hypothetical protein